MTRSRLSRASSCRPCFRWNSASRQYPGTSPGNRSTYSASNDNAWSSLPRLLVRVRHLQEKSAVQGIDALHPVQGRIVEALESPLSGV